MLTVAAAPKLVARAPAPSDNPRAAPRLVAAATPAPAAIVTGTAYNGAASSRRHEAPLRAMPTSIGAATDAYPNASPALPWVNDAAVPIMASQSHVATGCTPRKFAVFVQQWLRATCRAGPYQISLI
jgi:hypothetical protein